MNSKTKIFHRVIVSIILSFVFTQCKKDENVIENHLNKDTVKKDTTKKDSVSKNGMVQYSAFIFPKKSRDSAMAIFLEKYNQQERHTILALNRLDNKNKWRADTLIIPKNLSSDFLQFSPFPSRLDSLKNIKKNAFFSYKIHAYALYENGNLVKWGPTSMGKKSTPTKTGLKFTNWKKEIAISTSNSEWKLRWNFNVHNSLGIGWHQYDLPGFHASHSCMRLLEEDAKWMYNWANQWVLTNDGNTVLAKGTPLIIFGTSDFTSKPWLKLLKNPQENNFSVEEMNTLFLPFLEEILKEQKNSEEIRIKREQERLEKTMK